MPRRKKTIDWTDAPDADAPERRMTRPLSPDCYGGPDAPSHRSVGCALLSWSLHDRVWLVCGCRCHDRDLTDGGVLDELKEREIVGDRAHRLAYGF